ncbi:MAG: FKBP-type peptidyl-prolyl cis-trans isomerase [Elusimicrobia bacterium]|nr:FKBP-type peptidyl-prolyl cis-trans isomerase [Elusimicrobiota bacterium]
MKTILSGMLALALIAPVWAEEAKSDLPSDESQALYLLGASLAQRASEFALGASDLKYVKMGLEDFVKDPQKLKVDPEAVNPKLQSLRETRISKRAGAEKKKGEEYAAKALKEKGAEKIPNGAIVIPMKEGTGANPKATDKVKVHYHGTFIDGKVFDSSVQRNQPAEFPLNGVIPCWTEGVQKIKVGGKAKLVCPSAIAYGDSGRPSIPGGATLVFEVELLEILK